MKLTKSSKVLLFFSLFILSIVSVRADDLDIPEEEVVVTATRTSQTRLESPGMTEVIDAEKVQASGATNVSELLAKEGFVVSSYGGASGAATFKLDGCDATQTLVLVNGIPENSGTMGEVDLSYFPTAGISKIEVAHGPLSSLYGSGALGGVVNIITDLTGEPLNSVSMAYGTTDRSKADTGDTAVSIRRNNYGLTFGGGRDDGFRANSKSENYFLLYQYDF
ncbi:MAG: TonB-dependent receptor, partial [Firmicutes bacterium]|nr:TonB-dependent receptor [Bacillota bacterium]